MAIHLLRDLDALKKDLLTVGSLVEDATNKAILALVDRRVELAEAVLRSDREVDKREVRLEDACLKVLALHQPVAADLRFVVTVLKVNNDLERVGDLAGNIAERAISIAQDDPVAVPAEINTMTRKAQNMLRDSLNALVDQNTTLARQVLDEDETVDELHSKMYSIMAKRMVENPRQIDTEIQLLSVSRYLERIADLATNIAEDIVFLVDGDVIRHRQWD